MLTAAVLFAGCARENAEITTPEETAENQSVWEMPAQAEVRETQEALTEDDFYYAQGTLETQEERQVYQEMLRSLTDREKETELSTLNPDLLEPVFSAVMADHPEIFYTDGYSSTTYKLGTAMKKITFTGSYTMEEDEIRARSQALENACAQWAAGLADGMDDYEKAKYLYEYLIAHTDYEQGAADSQNICSVLLNGRSVCQGYAKTLQLLCQQARIPALLVTGQVKGQGHAWNLLKLDGEWYHVDPTWGDASYLQEGEAGYTAASFPAVNYDYFCVTTGQIKRTHVIDTSCDIPVCLAVKNHYYRREGRYLETADADQIASIFEQAAAGNEKSVTFQCADDTVYAEVYRLLIEEQKVFDYLPKGDTKAAYADSPQQRTFSFWLTGD